MPGIDLNRAYPHLFTAADNELLNSRFNGMRTFRARETVAQPGVRLTQAAFLQAGFVGCFRSDAQGRRQFMSLHIPGDFIDLQAFMLGHMDHEAEAFSAVTVSYLPHPQVAALRQEGSVIYDQLGHVLLVDASIQRYWTFRNGRLTGRARIASLFAETLVRQYARGLADLDSCLLPISQTDLAEACGMTPVHANRMLGELRDERICMFIDGRIEVLDLLALFREGQFHWDYLYLPAEADEQLVAISQGRKAPPRSAWVRLAFG